MRQEKETEIKEGEIRISADTIQVLRFVREWGRTKIKPEDLKHWIRSEVTVRQLKMYVTR